MSKMVSAPSAARRALVFGLALVAMWSAMAAMRANPARAAEHDDVAITDDGPNRLDLWTVNTAGEIVHKSWQSGSGWTAWENLGGSTVSAVNVIHFPDHRYTIYARGSDDALWLKTYYPPGYCCAAEGWTAWQSAGGAYSSGIQAAYSDGGKWVDVVGRDKNNDIDWRVWTTTHGWQGESKVPGPVASAPALVDWTPPGASVTQGDLFAVGSGHDVLHNVNANMTWGGWNSVWGNSTSAISGDSGNGQMTITTRGADGHTAYVNTYKPGSPWSDWQNIGGNLGSSPTIHYWPNADGSPRWIVVGRDQADTSIGRPAQVVRTVYTGGAWSGWAAVAPAPGVTYYGTSVAYGGDNHVIDTQPERDAVAAVIHGEHDLMVVDNLKDGIAPAERAGVDAAVKLAGLQDDVRDDVAITDDGPDRLDLWAVNTDSVPVHKYWRAGIGWSAWESLGGTTASPLSVIHFPDHRYTIYARGGDDALWTKTYYPSGYCCAPEGWTDWTREGGQYSSSIQAAYSDGGKWVDVVGLDAQKNVDWRVWTAAHGWERESKLTGPVYTAPSIVDWTPPGASATQGEIYTVGSGGDIIRNINVNMAWGGWNSVFGQPTSGVYGDSGDGKVRVVTRGPDGHTAYIAGYQPGSSWTSWDDLGGYLSSSPTLHYWPTADGAPRWIVIARDEADPSNGRPAQVIRKEFLNGAWTSWKALAPSPGVTYYGTSIRYGGDGINNANEIDDVVGALVLEEPMVADNMIDGIAPAERQAVIDAYNAAMTDRTVAELDAAVDDGAARAIVAGLTSADSARLDSALHARVNNGDYIRDIATGKVYYYANGVIQWIPSQDFAAAAGIDLGSVKRITHAGLSGWTVGADATYATSWRYGGGDHAVNDPAEINQLAIDEDAANSTGRDSLWAGLSPNDQAALSGLNPAIRYADVEDGSLPWMYDDPENSDSPVATAASGIQPTRAYAPANWCAGRITGIAYGTSDRHKLYVGTTNQTVGIYRVGLSARTYDCDNGHSRTYFSMWWDTSAISVSPVLQWQMVRRSGQLKPYTNSQGESLLTLKAGTKWICCNTFNGDPYVEMWPMPDGSAGRVDEVRMPIGFTDSAAFSVSKVIHVPMRYVPIVQP